MMRIVLLAMVWIANGSANAQDLPTPLTDADFRSYEAKQAKLGRLLFYDRVLSGTYRVSCASCHNHDRASSNGFLLEGKTEKQHDTLAINELPLYDALKPSTRHAPALFNVGAKQISALFSDGRVAQKEDGLFISPAEDELPKGLKDVLAVQALFPAVSDDELVGVVESDLKAATHLGNKAVWAAIAARIKTLPDYWAHFKAAYPDLGSFDDVDMVHIANAISAFVGTEWRADNSAFDRYLKGETAALGPQALKGMNLFYGEAGCSQCHTGNLLTDHKYHAIGAWPWRYDADFSVKVAAVLDGRITITGQKSDSFRHRTPALRNVDMTAPYGISGGYETLQEIIVAHFQPEDLNRRKIKLLQQYGGKGASQNVFLYSAIQNARRLTVSEFPVLASYWPSDQAVDDLIAFLRSLTDKAALKGRLGKPSDVPSSLALD